MKKAFLLITFTALFLGILAVYGQEEPKSMTTRSLPAITSVPKLMMRLMDLNSDGKISEEENKKFFTDADQDKDGSISIREIMNLMNKRQTEANGPNVGQDAPDITLTTLDGKNTIRISDYKGRDILVLVFGSYTSPPFRSQAETMERLYQQYKAKSQWLLVYIKEDHPADGWQVDDNVKDNIIINEPKTMEERLSVANECYKKLGLTFTAVVDGMDNAAEEAFASWPDRLYIVDKKGKIAYKGEKGPEGFKPEEMAQTLARLCST